MKVLMSGRILDAVLEPALAEDRLLLCPFCGSGAELVHTWTACYAVKCSADGCGAEVTGAHAGELRTLGRKMFGRKRKLDFYAPAHVAAAYDAVHRWNQRTEAQS